jgi:uncharacterized membrane protein YdbT with pleckstrin-like domain
MAFPQRLLAEDERVLLELHPHLKELVGPAALFVLTAGAASYAVAVLPAGPSLWRLLVLVAALLVLLVGVLWPLLRWSTTQYVLTDRRLVLRQGVISRSGRDLPLSRINDVSFRHGGVLQRMLRCGTLVVESAGERGQLVLRDLPRVEEVQRSLYRAVEDDERRRGRVRWEDS